MDVESGIRRNELLVTLILGTRMEPKEAAKLIAHGLSLEPDISWEQLQTPMGTSEIRMIFKRRGGDQVGLSVRIGKGPKEVEAEHLRLGASGEETKLVLTGWLVGNAQARQGRFR